jgi:hypothetical protein
MAERWYGVCYGCSHEREIESRPTHAMQALCDRCAAKPHRPPTVTTDEVADDASIDGARPARRHARAAPC